MMHTHCRSKQLEQLMIRNTTITFRLIVLPCNFPLLERSTPQETVGASLSTCHLDVAVKSLWRSIEDASYPRRRLLCNTRFPLWRGGDCINVPHRSIRGIHACVMKLIWSVFLNLTMHNHISTDLNHPLLFSLVSDAVVSLYEETG